ncbi:uncharacterized protein [Epargyreus clarus]|uniref:uncharacterized protein isoform X3 n=1 Tax=Epargyreus clarus TaxID=520877 RepID=UPI003C2D87D3
MSRVNEGTLHLIDLYKSMPYLWDKTHINYKNRKRRLEGYHVLLDVYKQYDKNATIKTTKTKIKNIRSGYFRELAKVKEAQSMGIKYFPFLYYYDAMSFLADAAGTVSSHEDVETIGIEERLWVSDEENEDSRLSDAPSTPPAKRQCLTPNFIQMPDSMIDNPETVQMTEEDYETLGKSIGIQLRDLSKTQLTITQKIISDAIYYARMDMLTEKSHIALQKDEPNPETSSGSITYEFEPYSKIKESP